MAAEVNRREDDHKNEIRAADGNAGEFGSAAGVLDLFLAPAL